MSVTIVTAPHFTDYFRCRNVVHAEPAKTTPIIAMPTEITHTH